jgi:hypothetical protein
MACANKINHQSAKISIRKPPKPAGEADQHTHPILCLLVSAGTQQQPHAVRVTKASGLNQRRLFVLRVRVCVCLVTVPSQRRDDFKTKHDKKELENCQILKLMEKIFLQM